jgi:hypothetical protein
MYIVSWGYAAECLQPTHGFDSLVSLSTVLTLCSAYFDRRLLGMDEQLSEQNRMVEFVT